jgi:antitoxin component YwqK of YwqJK toxin-antitoxin module
MSVRITTLDGIKIEEAHIEGGYYHRDGAPALILYYETGEIKEISYFQHGKRHSDGMDVTRTCYYKTGISSSRYFYENDKLNDRNGVAACQQYFDNGSFSHIFRYKNGIWHSLSGNAVCKFYKNGLPKLEEYIIDGNHHREFGPAVIHYKEDGTSDCEYWLNGYNYSNKQVWLAAIQATRIQTKPIYNGKGSVCRKCKVFYDYAEPDDDGMIICWGCENIG